jgi:Protein of unknown function (DUF3168)
MKDIRPPLRKLLLDDAAVAAIVGDRIFPEIMPQGERRTSVVFHIIDARAEYQMNGSSDLARDIIQFESVAVLPGSAAELSLAVHDRLSGFKGDVTVGASTVTIRGIFRSGGRNLYDAVTAMHRVAHDYSVWYKET